MKWILLMCSMFYNTSDGQKYCTNNDFIQFPSSTTALEYKATLPQELRDTSLLYTFPVVQEPCPDCPPPINQAPKVNAGEDQTITLPSQATLSGTASDDGLPNPPGTLTLLWRDAADTGKVTFANTSDLNTTATFSEAGTYVLRLIANDGLQPVADDVTITVIPSTPIPTEAIFLKHDKTTQGSWKGTYGSDGYIVQGDTSIIPNYAQVSISGGTEYIWASTTQDPRALQKAIGTDRIASTLYSYTPLTINIHLTDGATHQVAVYALDWDGNNRRKQTIEVIDSSGTLLDSRTLTNFSGGEYLAWTLKGASTLKILHQGGANAVISGIFFGNQISSTTPKPPISVPYYQGIEWDTVTTNTDNTPIDNLKGYYVYQSTISFNRDGFISTQTATTDSSIQKIFIPNSSTSYSAGPLTVGTSYYFRNTAVNTANVESGFNVDENDNDVEIIIFKNAE